jgi:hypothetical protein
VSSRRLSRRRLRRRWVGPPLSGPTSEPELSGMSSGTGPPSTVAGPQPDRSGSVPDEADQG